MFVSNHQLTCRARAAAIKVKSVAHSSTPARYKFLRFSNNAGAVRVPGGITMRFRNIAVFSAAALAGMIAGSAVGPRPAQEKEESAQETPHSRH